MLNYNPFIRFARLARDVARIKFDKDAEKPKPLTKPKPLKKPKAIPKQKGELSDAQVKKQNEKDEKARLIESDPDRYGGNLRGGWFRGNIAGVINNPDHIGAHGRTLTDDERSYLIEQGNARLAARPESTKGKPAMMHTWGKFKGQIVEREKPVRRTFAQALEVHPDKRDSAENDVIEQMTNEYAFSPHAIGRNENPAAPSSLPQIKNIPGNIDRALDKQLTFGQTLDQFSASDSGYWAGAGVVTIHGKQYLPGQGIPKAELRKLETEYPQEYKKLMSLGDHMPGSLTQNEKAAKIIGNSKAKLVPKGDTTFARLFTTAPNIGDNPDFQRTPAELDEVKFREGLIELRKTDNDERIIDQISHSDLVRLLPANHVALKVLTTDDMRMTYRALVNGVKAYNSAHSNNLRVGASAIGVTKRNWYRDSSKMIHAMFGLHDNGHDINHEDNTPIVIARKAQNEFKEWEKNQSKPKSAFLESAIDSARFSAVLAATSPGISVKSNLTIALHAWDAWEEYKESNPPKGFTYDNFVDWVEKHKGSVTLAKEEAEGEGEDGKGADTRTLAEWIRLAPLEEKVKRGTKKTEEVDTKKASVYGGSIKSALMGDEKKLLGLSTPLFTGGPKIENFRLACWGLSEKGVLDVWESYSHGVPQNKFGQKISTKNENLYTDADYKFFAAGFNEQADLLNKIQVAPEHPASPYYNSTDSTASKKNWEAADVQASGWCGLKGIIEYSVFNHMTLDQALDNMTVGDMDKVEEFSNLGLEILHGTSDKDSGLKAFMENTQRRHANSADVTSSVSTGDKQTKSLKELLETIKKGGVDKDTKIIKLIPEELIGHARAFLNRMAVNSGSGATAAFMSQAAKKLENDKALAQLKKLGRRLKFAQFAQAPGGMTGAPVATRTNQPFSNAVAKSPGGKNLAQGALGNQINAKGGVETTAQNAVGDWPNGSEESIVHTAPQGTDPARLKYLAAWHGISGQKKSVLVFHPNSQGPDSLYHITHPSTDMGEVRDSLVAAGINYKTLLPGKTNTKVLVYDPNRGMRNNVDQYATNNNLNVVENIGQGEIVGHNGDWNSAGALPKSRQAYTNIIGEYEQNNNKAGATNNTSGAPTNGTSTSTGQAQQLSRKTKAKIKFDRSRRVLEGFLRQHNTPNKELPAVGDLLSQDFQNIKPEHLSKYQQLIPDASWSDIEGAVSSLQNDPSLYDDMTSESNRREMYCKEHARTVLQSSGLKKLIDSLQVQSVIPEHAQHLIQDAKDGDYFSLEAISSELEHSVPSLRAFAKAAEKEYNKAGKVWDKMRTAPQPQKFAKKSAHAANQYRAGAHGITFRGRNYNGGQFAPQNDGVKRFEKDSNLTHMIKKLRGA